MISRKIAAYLSAAAVLILAAAIYFTYNPATDRMFPRCPFLMLTGLKCPGCGSQRAVHSLLHLDIGAAAGYNFMLVAAIPVIILLAYGELKRKSAPRLYSRINSPMFTWAVFAVVTAWWIMRNIAGW